MSPAVVLLQKTLHLASEYSDSQDNRELLSPPLLFVIFQVGEIACGNLYTLLTAYCHEVQKPYLQELRPFDAGYLYFG